jgi:Holliday junction resolvase-like predicted endonuclease
MCFKCGVPQTKIRKEKSDGKDQWLGECGRHWNGNTCPGCTNQTKTVRRRKNGILARKDIKEPRFQKAVKTESIVAKWFEQKGFTVERTKSAGPDLICKAGSVELKVEVKSACLDTQKGKAYWKVGKVHPKRIRDDLVAIVMPSQRIHFEDMETHLLKCDRSGNRQITRLVQLDMDVNNG